MEKTYQPEIIKLCGKFMNQLTEDGFFVEYQVVNSKPAEIVLCDFLTDKFIEGKIIDWKTVEVDDAEMILVLDNMISACSLNSLKEKGIMGSCDDENNDEIFFLTERGKKIGISLNDKN